MTRFEETTITCPNCGAAMPFTMYASVNAQLNPELAEQLMDGSLFYCACPECGEGKQVLHSCLYNDMEHRLMVQLTTEENAQGATEVFESVSFDDPASTLAAIAVGYDKRVVTSQNVLREKAMIVRDGYSDAVMELCKVIVTSMALEEEAIGGGDILLYMGTGDGILNFAVLGEEGQTGQIGFPAEAYATIAEEYKAVSAEKAGYFVDEAWALDILTRMGESE